MAVTKQQQLEWLINNTIDFFGMNVIHMSMHLIGEKRMELSSKYHVITREEWQQERDKMQKQQDNSWHERGELPPFNIVVEWDEWGHGNWVETKILADVGDGEFVMLIKDVKTIVGMPANFRPIRTEREKTINAACDAICENGVHDFERGVIEKLYDAGMLCNAEYHKQ